MLPKIISKSITYFILFNSFGIIPIILGLLARYTPQQQRKIILRESLIALFTLCIFILGGGYILSFLGIRPSVIGMAGGLLLLIIALNMVFPKQETIQGMPQHEPFIVPIGIPSLAGPATMTSSMLFAEQIGIVPSLIALFISWIPTCAVVLASSYIKDYLGDKGILAIERLGGMLLSMIAIQMMATGTMNLVKEVFF